MNTSAIRVNKVQKVFKLPHEKNMSLKSLIVNPFQQRQSFERQQALKDISFEVKKGEFFGIVGRNGSGKSTLLKILAGIYQPTSGSVELDGKLVPFIELGVGFNPELTGGENVYLSGSLLGFSKAEIDAIYDGIVEFAELEPFMDQKLKNFSSGMQVRLAFSLAIRADADILLVDEVLAVGDADFQRKCFDYFKKLKKDHKTVVFVSHDMGAIREYCDRAILIEKSEIIASGTATKIAKKYTQLFMETQAAAEIDDLEGDKRWGSHEAFYEKVEVKVEGEHIHIDATIAARSPVEKVLYGVHIASADGKEVVATNNRMMLADDIANIEGGGSATVHWTILNVFNDGQFFVTVTLADPISTVFDWYYDAAKFRIRRAEKSTTPILPPITTSYSLKGAEVQP